MTYDTEHRADRISGNSADSFRAWNWVQLAAGIVTIVLGIVAFAWPDATLRVVAFLFGLNLLATGVSRTALMFFTTGTPLLHRILGIIFGVFVAIVGILCMRNVTGSLALLLVIVAIGWLLDGLAAIVLAVGSGGPAKGWRIALGVGAMIASIALLVWPGLSLTAFLYIGATTLIVLGVGLTYVAIAALRTRPA
ncbi:HdeD family acid-resistance protein [Cryptosporangium minutisporangium]|uniref:HdeD family acid-resistance protein n=1 Tax=Cryptosporangium minutisporangium TaxID=113569 RepID=A0ABP6SSR5_9ACTN